MLLQAWALFSTHSVFFFPHKFPSFYPIARVLSFAKPVYNAIMRKSRGRPTIIVVSSRTEAERTATDLFSMNVNAGVRGVRYAA